MSILFYLVFRLDLPQHEPMVRETAVPIYAGQTVVTNYSDLGRRCFYVEEVVPYAYNMEEYPVGSKQFLAGEVYVRKIPCT